MTIRVWVMLDGRAKRGSTNDIFCDVIHEWLHGYYDLPVSSCWLVRIYPLTSQSVNNKTALLFDILLVRN